MATDARGRATPVETTKGGQPTPAQTIQRGRAIPEDTTPKVALVIAAHPDDPDFGAGGTAALWSRDGWEFHYCLVTNGEKGTADRSLSREALVAMREKEQRAAAEVLGVKSCTFLGSVDGELEYSHEVLGKIVRVIRRLRPHAVFTHSLEVVQLRLFRRLEGDPEDVGFINHRDHRTTGTMALDAIYPVARDHLNFPEHLEEGLEPHKVAEFYLWGPREPNFVVDISTVIDDKIRGLMHHTSQFGDRGEDFSLQMRPRWQDEDGRYYERFQRVRLPR